MLYLHYKNNKTLKDQYTDKMTDFRIIFNKITKGCKKYKTYWIMHPFLSMTDEDLIDDCVTNGNTFMTKAARLMAPFTINQKITREINFKIESDQSVHLVRKIFTSANITKYTIDTVMNGDFLNVIALNRSLNIVVVTNKIIDEEDENENEKHMYDITSFMNKKTAYNFLFVYYEGYDEFDYRYVRYCLTNIEKGIEIHANLVLALEEYKSM